MIRLERPAIAPLRLLDRLLAVGTILIVVVVATALVRAGREWLRIRHLTQAYTQLTGVKPSELADRIAQREEMVKRMSSNRLIAPPPAFQLTGVLGDEAVFNGGTMLKVGQSAGDMKILTIGPDWVEVETNGQTRKLWVFPPMTPSGPVMAGPSPGRVVMPHRAPHAPATTKMRVNRP